MYILEDENMISNEELIKLISNEVDVRQYVVKKVLQGLGIVVEKQINYKRKIKINGFGIFSRIDHAPRRIRNIHTGELEVVNVRPSVKFSPSKTLKGKIK